MGVALVVPATVRSVRGGEGEERWSQKSPKGKKKDDKGLEDTKRNEPTAQKSEQQSRLQGMSQPQVVPRPKGTKMETVRTTGRTADGDALHMSPSLELRVLDSREVDVSSLVGERL